jgi:phenylpropionate dioxygenase-like ring-hydroxylating dioxygenase large terminal subunit
MVHVATRGDEVPARLGPDVPQLPGWGTTVVDREVYADPERFELEREHVLRRSWILAGRSVEIPEPGDWLSFEGHGETAVITRQRDGSLAAFHNVCQHRGPSFVKADKGCGARRFSCPYHGWVYDTTGKLVGVPEREDFDAEELQGLRAPLAKADEWGGWIWLYLDGDDEDAPSLTDWIGPDITLDLGRFEMENMILDDKLVWDVPVSYKAIVDGFNEVYHATELHSSPPEFTKAARNTSFWFTGQNSMMFVPRYQTLDKLAETGDHLRYSICHYVVFPNTVFNCNPQHIQVFNPIPIDVDRTRFITWQLIYPGDRSDPEYNKYWETTQAHWEVLKKVVGEDISIYDQLSRTKRSPAYTKNILSDRECKIGKYHDTMQRLVTERSGVNLANPIHRKPPADG